MIGADVRLKEVAVVADARQRVRQVEEGWATTAERRFVVLIVEGSLPVARGRTD
jgi:hypothetical protein